MVEDYGQAADSTDDLQWLLGGAQQWELLEWFPRHVALNTRDRSITVAHTDTEGEKKDTKLLLQPPISVERNGETDLELVLLARAGAVAVDNQPDGEDGEDGEGSEDGEDGEDGEDDEDDELALGGDVDSDADNDFDPNAMAEDSCDEEYDSNAGSDSDGDGAAMAE